MPIRDHLWTHGGYVSSTLRLSLGAVLILADLGATQGCVDVMTDPDVPNDVPSFDVPPFDGGVDAPDGGPDSPDVWVEEQLCMTPGERQFVPCEWGERGVRLRECTDEHVWDYRACGEDCPEEGCELGTGVVTAAGCPGGQIRVRVCDGCRMGPFGPCFEPPADLDRDGTPAATDCDDSDPRVRPGTSSPCGEFLCGYDTAGQPIVRPGTRSCIGPGYTTCVRPDDCSPDGAICSESFAFERESYPCATLGPDCPTLGPRRRCNCPPAASECGWAEWLYECSSEPVPPRPSNDCGLNGLKEDLLSRPCGSGCGAGAWFLPCGSGCGAPRVCLPASGCTPGTVAFGPAGCPPGEHRAFACDLDCTLTVEACRPVPAEVDVMLLVDHPWGEILPAVDALLIDERIRVGIAFTGDFPILPYGTRRDVPFAGLLAPSRDLAAIEAALRGVVTEEGEDYHAGLEALSILAGSTPPASARPFVGCPEGSGGGCWRPGAARVIVVQSGRHHGFPRSDGTLIEPYDLEVMPPPPSAEEVGAAVRAERILVLGVPRRLALAMGLEEHQALADSPTEAIFIYRLPWAIYSWIGEP